MSKTSKLAPLFSLEESVVLSYLSDVNTTLDRFDGAPSVSGGVDVGELRALGRKTRRSFVRYLDIVRCLSGAEFRRPVKTGLSDFVERLAAEAERHLRVSIPVDLDAKDEGLDFICDKERFARLFFIAASVVARENGARLKISGRETLCFRLESKTTATKKLPAEAGASCFDADIGEVKADDPRMPFFYAEAAAKAHKGDVVFGSDASSGDIYAEITVPRLCRAPAGALRDNAKLIINIDEIAEEEFSDVL